MRHIRFMPTGDGPNMRGGPLVKNHWYTVDVDGRYSPSATKTLQSMGFEPQYQMYSPEAFSAFHVSILGPLVAMATDAGFSVHFHPTPEI